MGKLLLPLIGVIALTAIAVTMEFVARGLYSETGVPSCLIFSDSTTGARAKPRSVCDQKIFESKMAEYRFNGCGHRNPQECGAKRPGVYRITLVGSSLALGFPVTYEESFQGLMPELLSQQTKRNVEVYSEGMELRTPHYVLLNFNEVIDEHPDMILWPMTPWDVDNVDLMVPAAAPPEELGEALKSGSLWAILKEQLVRRRDIGESLGKRWRAFFMMQHFLYKSDTVYLAHSLSGSDSYASSLRDLPDKDWQSKLGKFEKDLTAVADRANAAGIRVVVVALPRHAQAAIIASGDPKPGMNPYAFGDQMKAIVERHGGVYVDILKMFRGMPDVNSAFFPVDQHLTADGYREVARMMTLALTAGPSPVLGRLN